MAPVHRFLAFVIGALLVAGAAGVGAMVYEPPTQVAAAAATTTTVALLAVPPPAPPPAPVTPATAPPPAATEAVEGEAVEIVEETTTTVSPTTTTTIPGSKPPASGSYRYRKKFTDEEGSFEFKGRIIVQSAREAGGEIRQEHLDSDPEFGTSSEEYVWRADGVFLHAVGDPSGEDAHKCDIQPDILLYPLPLTVGQEWTIDSSCSYQIEGEQVTDRFQGTSQITRTDRVVVAGQEVDVYVIETSGQLSDGEFSVEFKSTDFFSPDVRLTVRENTHNRYLHNGEATGEEDEEFELLTLQPQ